MKAVYNLGKMAKNDHFCRIVFFPKTWAFYNLPPNRLNITILPYYMPCKKFWPIFKMLYFIYY